MARTRSAELGPAARPVAVPDDVDDLRSAKAGGRVTLPHHVHWTAPRAEYDLDDPHDRALVYELVLQEGTDDDVRRFIDVDQLLAMWDVIVLPPWVRRRWADWFSRHRGADLSC